MRGCRKGLRVSLQVIPAAVNIQVQKRNETNKSNLRRWRHNATMLQCCAHLLSQLFVKLILVRKPGRGYDCSHVVCACGEGGRCLCCCGSGFGRRISCVPVRERREIQTERAEGRGRAVGVVKRKQRGLTRDFLAIGKVTGRVTDWTKYASRNSWVCVVSPTYKNRRNLPVWSQYYNA